MIRANDQGHVPALAPAAFTLTRPKCRGDTASSSGAPVAAAAIMALTRNEKSPAPTNTPSNTYTWRVARRGRQ